MQKIDCHFKFQATTPCTFTIQLNTKQPDKGGRSEEQLIKISAKDNITLNPSKCLCLTLKYPQEDTRVTRLGKQQQVGIITPNTTRLQGYTERNALETTRG